jgi:hypothetical protein
VRYSQPQRVTAIDRGLAVAAVRGIVRTSSPAVSRARQSDAEWWDLYMVDILALPLIGAVTMKFWCALFGVRDVALVVVLMVAVLGDAVARIAAARRDRRRPATFHDERRLDLMAGLAVGIGPWPIAQMMGAGFGPALQAPGFSTAARLAVVLAIVMTTAWRLAAATQPVRKGGRAITAATC